MSPSDEPQSSGKMYVVQVERIRAGDQKEEPIEVEKYSFYDQKDLTSSFLILKILLVDRKRRK